MLYIEAGASSRAPARGITMAHYDVVSYTPTSGMPCPMGLPHLRDADIRQTDGHNPPVGPRRTQIAALLHMVATGDTFSIERYGATSSSRAEPVSFPLCESGAGYHIEPRVSYRELPLTSWYREVVSQPVERR